MILGQQLGLAYLRRFHNAGRRVHLDLTANIYSNNNGANEPNMKKMSIVIRSCYPKTLLIL